MAKPPLPPLAAAPALDPTARFRVKSAQVSRRLGEETVLLDLSGGVYYSLDEVGSFVWQELHSPRTLVECCQAVAEHFEVTSRDCEADLGQLLAELLDRGLIEAVEVPAS